jgi:hypothetical protein
MTTEDFFGAQLLILAGLVGSALAYHRGAFTPVEAVVASTLLGLTSSLVCVVYAGEQIQQIAGAA